MVRIFRKSVSANGLMRIYNVLFLPYLLYAIECLYPTRKGDRTVLERTQKFSIRLILKNFNRDVSYDTLLSTAKMRAIYHTVFIRRLCLFYKYVNGLRFIPSCCINFVRDSNKRRSSRLSHFYLVDLSQYGTYVRCKSCFLYLCSRAFNCLPFDVVSVPFTKFKRKLSDRVFFQSNMNKLRPDNSRIVDVIEI